MRESFETPRPAVACPPRITVVSAAEPCEPFISEALLLFKTLRLFGGAATGSQCIVYFIGPVDGETAESFARLDVLIYVVNRFDSRCPHANKLRLMEPQVNTDYVVALDTDIVVAGDFSEHLIGEAILAKVVDQDPLTLDVWRRLFAHFGMLLPQARFLTSFHNSETIPYFNSGVLCVPNLHVTTLAAAWSKATLGLLDAYDALPEITAHRFFTDQFALSLALHAAELPYRALPLELNFPTHAPLHPACRPDIASPVLIHHHRRRSSNGAIECCAYDGPNRTIERMNAVILTLGNGPLPTHSYDHKNDESFNNRDFWERRYVEAPVCGSGIGSRGEHAVYKRRVIQAFLDDARPRTILDIGCGDLEVMRGVTFDADYHGLDVSENVLDRNRAAHPDKSFTCVDFVRVDDVHPYTADVVLCFDVLIHQHRLEDYEILAARLVRATRHRALLSGFVSRPRSAYRSAITSYHEPLTITLKRFGARDIKIIGAYRDTNVVSFSTS